MGCHATWCNHGRLLTFQPRGHRLRKRCQTGCKERCERTLGQTPPPQHIADLCCGRFDADKLQIYSAVDLMQGTNTMQLLFGCYSCKNTVNVLISGVSKVDLIDKDKIHRRLMPIDHNMGSKQTSRGDRMI